MLGRPLKEPAMRHRPWPLILLAALAALLPAAAFADGKSWIHAADYSGWRPLHQHEQHAFLSLEGGTEHMLIAINLQLEQEDAHGFWLFPVPGTPETVSVDLLNRFPATHGLDVIAVGRDRIIDSVSLEIAVVINPVLPFVFLPAMHGHRHRDSARFRIHRRVEKHGLRAETVTANSTEALSQYLAGHEVELEASELALFEPYLNDSYVLVAASIASAEALHAAFPDDERWTTDGAAHRQPALYVTFPADKLFYPMRPTAGYGDQEMTVSIATIGHTMPEGDAAMLAEADHHHYVQDHASPNAFPSGMRGGLTKGEPLYYSRLEFRCPAKAFTSDLTFAPKNARFSRYQRFMGARRFTGIPIPKFFVLLYITGGVCGLVFFGTWWRPALYGLLGFMSFPVVSHFTWRDLVHARGRKPRAPALLYALGFLMFFIALNAGVTALLLLPLRY
jgi:hypothetical protein